MARALIVGCGCRGRRLGMSLTASGWQVRGTARDDASLELIAAAGIEPVAADPDRVATVLEAVDDVAVVFWTLASATGTAESVAAVNGPRLERLLERLVDTPVRGLVYEAGGSAPEAVRLGGAQLVRAAGERWRIPVAVVDESPTDTEVWVAAMRSAAERVLGLT